MPLIKKYEGLHLKAYWDYKGYSIGYGTRSYEGETITKEEAQKRFDSIVYSVINTVQKDFPNLTVEQQAALVSFNYNCYDGYKSVRDNGLQYHSKWCKKAGGIYHSGLAERRNEEAKLLFNSSEISPGDQVEHAL